MFPSAFAILPDPAAEKHRQSMMLPPPGFTMEMVCFWYWAMFGVRQT